MTENTIDKLKVFLSWSGEWSKLVAESLKTWLPDVLQFVEPWLSSDDIEKGSRWSIEIARELQNTRLGIICLTPDNIHSPWILFEAGALSKTIENTYVCTFLHGLRKADLAPPLSQFQATEVTQADIRRLIQTLNQANTTGALSADQCSRAFDRWWPELQRQLGTIQIQVSGNKSDGVVRSDREVLEEILELSRMLARERGLEGTESLDDLWHESRTPLNVILGYAGILTEGMLGPLEENQIAAVQTMAKRTKEVQEVLDKILRPQRKDTSKR